MPQGLKNNPFRPGAGHMPPYLAGRSNELDQFQEVLKQNEIMQNVVLTGLRGVGKTVLLESFKPEAHKFNWLWVGTDLSESATVSEESIATRLLTDIAVITANITVARNVTQGIGFVPSRTENEVRLDYESLVGIYQSTPGLVADKLKAVLEVVWRVVSARNYHGIVFAYDEAQTLSDRSEKEQYPLSLLLEVFQSVQRKGMRFLLVLTGLPTLYPKLVLARTFAERMFRVISLEKLDDKASRQAITKPVEASTKRFTPQSVETIVELSGGYPYFIQFICREVYDVWIQQDAEGKEARVPVNEIQQKLDTDFFAGRWARVTDRQRELLIVIAGLENAEDEFSVQSIVEASKAKLSKPFSASHVNQMLNSLADAGLIFRNRHGRYSLAVPLLNRFINRHIKSMRDLA
jgi:hypothetical protein